MKNRNMNIIKKLGLTVSLAAAFGLVSGGVFTGVVNATGAASGTQSAIESTAEAGTDSANINTLVTGDDASVHTSATSASVGSISTSGLTVSDVAANSMPALVAITNITVEEVQNYFGGFGLRGGNQTTESVSMGTGVIYKDTGDQILIATNAHVVNGATELSVAFVDDSAASAQIVGEDTGNDLAVISVNKSDLSEETLAAITVVTLGSSDELVVGEQVVAIGNALGYGQSVSTGIVSALNRQIQASSEDGSITQSEGLIQTDAAINPGNSGGALLNMQGQLIGINSSKYADTEVEGMGYAIPISYALPILTDLEDGSLQSTVATFGSAENGTGNAYMGITGATVSQSYSQYYGIPQGVYVNEITAGSGAEAAGLASGDIITAIDGVTVSSIDDLTSILSHYNAGDTAVITISRTSRDFGGNSSGYTSYELSITFGSKDSVQVTRFGSNR